MTRRTAHDAAQHVFDLIASEAERAEKLETEVRKLRKQVDAMKIANASALGFIKRHQIGNSLDGFGIRKLLLKTMKGAA